MAVGQGLEVGGRRQGSGDHINYPRVYWLKAFVIKSVIKKCQRVWAAAAVTLYGILLDVCEWPSLLAACPGKNLCLHTFFFCRSARVCRLGLAADVMIDFYVISEI